jgi:hypothetical protein
MDTGEIPHFTLPRGKQVRPDDAQNRGPRQKISILIPQHDWTEEGKLFIIVLILFERVPITLNMAKWGSEQFEERQKDVR